MVRSIIIGVLTVGLIGVSIWGYQEHEKKNDIYIQAENNYQRAFHELTYNMDLLHDKIGTSLAMNSAARISPHFVDIWKLSSVAQSNVSELPLGLLPFERAKEFLASIGDFTYKTAVRNLDDDPLTKEELETLDHFNTQAAAIKDELRQAQHTALSSGLQWMDVELALINNDDGENAILDSFRTVEDNIGEFADGTDGADIMKTETDKDDFSSLTGKNKSEQQIKEYSKDLLHVDDLNKLSVTKSGKAASVPNYNVSYEADNTSIFMDISEKGAHPITMLVNRPVEAQEISLNDGLIEAETYVKQFDYEKLTLLESKQFNNVGVYTFLYTEGDVRVFSDEIVVKVALDNGEVIGLNAREYLKNHKKRSIPKAKLTVTEAKEYVNENVQIEEEHMAIVENELGEEVLVHEFLGVLQDDTYRIFINAENGHEERVEKLTDTETNFEANI